MKAALVTGNRQVVVTDIPAPVLTKNTQIKIKVVAGAICNTTDNKVYATDTPEKDWPFLSFPFVIGHECTGYVIEKGDAVLNLALGDKIVYWTVDGLAFAGELVIDTATSVAGKINADVPDQIAAMMEMVIGSARLLFEPSGTPIIQAGDRVALMGLGPACLIYTRLALLMGADRVVAYGRRAIRLETALKLGACAAIDAGQPDAIQQTLAALGGPADVVIDATGGDVIPQIIALSKPGTKVVTYGIPPFSWKDRLHELTETGILHFKDDRSSALHALRQTIAWANEGKLGLEPIITHRLPMGRVGEGLDLCRDGRDTTLKVIIDINPDYRP